MESLSSSQLVGFVATASAKKARAFYEKTLQLQVVSEDGFAIVLRMNDALIRVTKVEKFTPQPFTVLGWEVTNLERTAIQLLERGVNFERYGWAKQDSLGVWTSPDGSKVVWFKDPDGNLLSLTQAGEGPEAEVGLA